MKRAGFTMIELIFVIVILGILSAVALPKFIGVSNQAHDQKVNAFVGTLNRTVGPSMWAMDLANGNGGVVVGNECSNMLTYIDDVPAELTFNSATCEFDKNTTAGGRFDINITDGNATSAPTWSTS